MTKEQFNYINGIIDFAVWPLANENVISFVACQFALESNFGRSLLARKYHNHCGMKRALKRLTHRSDSDGVFAHYVCLCDCILDYIDWLSYNRFSQFELHNLEAFKLHLVKSAYCLESDYVDRINSIYQQFKNYKNA